MIYNDLPSNFNKKMDVVGCFIEFEGKFILLHRQDHKSYGGTWGMPAGKVDPDETLSQAIIREVAEETGIDLVEDKVGLLDSLFVRHDGVDFEYHMFSTHMDIKPQVEINLDEHQSFTWVLPEEALSMNLIYDLDECIRRSYNL